MRSTFGSANTPTPTNVNPNGPSHVFTSVLAHSAAHNASPARGPRHFDVLGRRNQSSNGTAQQNAVSKDNAMADHQLQQLVRLKGASILRQRLLFLLRRKFEKEMALLDPRVSSHIATIPSDAQSAAGSSGQPSSAALQIAQVLHAVEELIISTDNSDVENAGYLRNFVKHLASPPESANASPTAVTKPQKSASGKGLTRSSSSGSNAVPASAAATSLTAPTTQQPERPSSVMAMPSFFLQSSSFGAVPLSTSGSRFGIGPVTSTASQSASDSDVGSTTCEDDEDDDSEDAPDEPLTPEPDASPKHDASSKPKKPTMICTVDDDNKSGMSGLRPHDFYAMRVKRVAGTGTVACPKCLHNLADFPATVDAVVADASTNTAERSDSEKDFVISALTKAKADAEKRMEEMKKELLAFKKAKYANQTLAAPVSQGSPNNRAPSAAADGSSTFNANDSFSLAAAACSPTTRLSGPVALFGGDAQPGGDLPPVRASSTTALNRSGAQHGSPNRANAGTPAANRRTTSSTLTVRRSGASDDAAPQTPPGLESDSRPGSRMSHSNAASPTSNSTSLIKASIALRANANVKELRSKLHAIKSGIRSFQFKEVIHQFAQHVLPQIQSIQAANKRLMDRDYILEKLLLDALCKVGTMADAGSPEGYLPEGGPLHVGTYSLLDDRRFLEWTRRINDTLSGKVAAVQAYMTSLTHDVKHQQSSQAGSRRELTALEERILGLETALVENECYNVSNILDHTFDSSMAVQGTRRTELVSLLKHAAETNEEIRLVYVIPNWASKPQLRVKLNMWRQRRMEALQRIEQLLSQELQHFVSSGAQKIMLKGKLMTLRELMQLASRLTLLGSSGAPPALATSTTTSASAAASPGSPVQQQRSAGQQLQSSSSAQGLTSPQQATSPKLTPSPSFDAQLSPVDRHVPQVSAAAAVALANGEASAAAQTQQPCDAMCQSPNGGMVASLRDSVRSPPSSGSSGAPPQSQLLVRRAASSQSLAKLPPVKKGE